MMQILVIDDRPEKIERVKKVLVERCALQEENINVAESVSSGIKEIKSRFYDLVILDLNLPQFDRETATEDGGMSLLKMLKADSNVKPPLQIICLTEYANIVDNQRSEFEGMMVSTIVKKEGDSQWIDQLADKVIYSQRLRYHVTEVLSRVNRFNLGIICAIQEEFDMLLEAFGREKWSDFPLEGVAYRFKQITVTTESVQTVKIVAACAGAPGGIATAALSALMYGTLKVDCLFMTGITGGIPKGNEIQLGDVVIAKTIQEYASGKISEHGDGKVDLQKENTVAVADAELISRMSEYISDEEVVAKMNVKVAKAHLKVKEREQYNIMIAPTVSGPFVMTSPQVVKELVKNDRKLRAIDMEGFALYYTAHQYKKPALWIKGISDFADMKKADDYHKEAAFASAVLVNMFIKEKLEAED